MFTQNTFLTAHPGTLTEVTGRRGSGKAGLTLDAIVATHAPFVWIEDRLSIYPVAVSQRGAVLEDVLFVEAGELALWAALQVLRAQVFHAVVIGVTGSRPERALGGPVALRRLQIAAEKARARVILLDESPIEEGAWALAARYQVQRNPVGEPVIEVVKYREVSSWLQSA